MRVLVTGGAGFIGSHICDMLLADGHEVVAYDNMTLGRRENVLHLRENAGFELIQSDILDDEALGSAIARGVDCIFHMAANSDIARSHSSPSIDLQNTFLTTFRVLEMMRSAGINKLVFASTSAVYGEAVGEVAEDYGPLQPISHYGAAKLASEAFISSYSENYGIQSWIVRFPNVVGPRATHGAIYDFVKRLKENARDLKVLGDGTQEKPYLYVLDLVEAIRHVWTNADDRFNAFNIGPNSRTKVSDIARFVVEASGLDASISYTGGRRGWIGDVPKFAYDARALAALGWKPSMSSDEAVRAAARNIWFENQ